MPSSPSRPYRWRSQDKPKRPPRLRIRSATRPRGKAAGGPRDASAPWSLRTMGKGLRFGSSEQPLFGQRDRRTLARGSDSAGARQFRFLRWYARRGHAVRGEGHGNCLLQNNPMQSSIHGPRLLVGDMSQPRGRPMMTARCSEASAAFHHGAARDTAGRDRPIPKRIGQTFLTPARRGWATSSKTSARKWPASARRSGRPRA
jgi:hypothetical protein